VVVAIKKYSELPKAAAEKGHVDVVRELLEIGASLKISKKYSRKPFIMAAENGNMEVLRLLQNHVDN
jgi:ankyrin repeat protein